MRTITVNLGPRSYPIIVGKNILSTLGSEIQKRLAPSQILVITDRNVEKLYKKPVTASLKKAKFSAQWIVIPPGETSKTLKIASHIYDQLATWKVHRDACIVALGGGVVGDLAGFVASTYMRGIPLVHVPTSMVAQVDSAIGGKTGVDHPKAKNLIGTFYQPVFVWTDVACLKTLSPEEFRNGMAEVVKYGIIKDSALFSLLEDQGTPENLWEEMVTRSAEVKAWVVSEDERESGLRMILNFGHTIGHAIETVTHYKMYRHGEAISIGMVAASTLAWKMGLCSEQDAFRVKALLGRLGLPMTTRLSQQKILATMGLDKKVKAGKIRLVLPRHLGEVEVRGNVPSRLLQEALGSVGIQ